MNSFHVDGWQSLHFILTVLQKNTGYFREDSRIPVFGASHLTTSSRYLQSKKHFNSYKFCFYFKFCLHFGQKLYFLKITEGNGIQLSSVGIEYKQRHLNQRKHNLSRARLFKNLKPFKDMRITLQTKKKIH